MTDSANTKQLILDMTRQIIQEDGLQAISMRELGKRLALSRGAVYVYFKNKEELLAYVTTENFYALKDQLENNISHATNSREIAFQILYTFYTFGIENQEYYQLMFLNQWDSTQHEDLHAAAKTVFGVFFKNFKKLDGLQGKIQKSPELLSSMASSMILGLVELNTSGHLEAEKGLNDPLKVIYSFIDLIFV